MKNQTNTKSTANGPAVHVLPINEKEIFEGALTIATDTAEDIHKVGALMESLLHTATKGFYRVKGTQEFRTDADGNKVNITKGHALFAATKVGALRKACEKYFIVQKLDKSAMVAKGDDRTYSWVILDSTGLAVRLDWLVSKFKLVAGIGANGKAITPITMLIAFSGNKGKKDSRKSANVEIDGESFDVDF